MDIDYRVVEIAQKEGTPLYIFDVVTLKKDRSDKKYSW